MQKHPPTTSAMKKRPPMTPPAVAPMIEVEFKDPVTYDKCQLCQKKVNAVKRDGRRTLLIGCGALTG
jgi:hypothetical protein